MVKDLRVRTLKCWPSTYRECLSMCQQAMSFNPDVEQK